MRVIGNIVQTKKVRGVCDPIPTNLFSSLSQHTTQTLRVCVCVYVYRTILSAIENSF